MNIYMTDKSAHECGKCVPEAVWQRRFMDAIELVSLGAQFWADEPPEFICHEPEHAWSRWVLEHRENWLWALAYLKSFAGELQRRKRNIKPLLIAYVDFMCDEYYEFAMPKSLAPRCVPAKHKTEKNSEVACVLAYRRYVRSVGKLHDMGNHRPAWINEAIVI